MNSSKLNLTFALLALCSGMSTNPVAAQEATEAPVSRAEVLADLQIWRESGLAAAQTGDSSDPQSPQYVQSLARYNALRGSAMFTELVERIARQRSESGLTARR
jgi:hypothetical protein